MKPRAKTNRGLSKIASRYARLTRRKGSQRRRQWAESGASPLSKSRDSRRLKRWDECRQKILLQKQREQTQMQIKPCQNSVLIAELNSTRQVSNSAANAATFVLPCSIEQPSNVSSNNSGCPIYHNMCLSTINNLESLTNYNQRLLQQQHSHPIIF